MVTIPTDACIPSASSGVVTGRTRMTDRPSSDFCRACAADVTISPEAAPGDAPIPDPRAVAAGLADIAVVNTYYLGILANSKEKKDRDVFNKVSVFFPNQNNRGTHINISGAGIAKYSKNKSDAIKFIEFLTSPEAQETFGKVNYEYPLFIENNKSDLLKSWGTFKADKQNLSILGIRNSEAVKLFDRADWK